MKKRNRELSEKQLKFAKLYDGNGTQTAKKAGYRGPINTLAQVASYLLRNEKVKAIIENKRSESLSKDIATKEQRQKFWTEVMTDTTMKIQYRLQASELLGKSQGDFITRMEHSVSEGAFEMLAESRKRAFGAGK